MQIRQTRLGELTCRLLPHGEGTPRWALVLCHGFGAPGDDLVPLGSELTRRLGDAPPGLLVFPGAPHAPPELAPFEGRAWWPIDPALLMAAQQGNLALIERLRDQLPEGLAPSRRQLRGMLDALDSGHGLSASRVVVGGFSQGAMLACEVALRLEEAPLGLVQLSGTPVDEGSWRTLASRRAGLPVFQSHGRGDPLLDFEHGGERLRALLTGAGLSVTFHPFEGGHGIDATTLDRLAAWLIDTLAAAGA